SKDDVDIYKKDCSPLNPLRCAMGDLSGRHGFLSVGSERTLISDPNLPLSGNYSVMGRSLIIFKSNGDVIPLGCANIKPDVHLVSNVAVRKNPAFTVAKFMSHMRGLLSTTDWLVVPDIHYTKDIANNECVQLSVNFYGPEAHKLQVEFSNLINLGTVKRQTRTGIQSVSTFYKPCKTYLSGRHGFLSVGSERTLISDPNLPLSGNYSVMGRSLIIFKTNGDVIPLGCANIKPDVHLVSNVAVRKNPAFTVAKFMSHMRALLNTTDWLVVPDIHYTKDIANNECVQLSVNFYGAEAHKLQVEFSNLINLGTVKRQTRTGIQSVSTFYKPCKTCKILPFL
ncbi:unnamed protein product, partial [Oppiella nova]